jgi:hypothetical protein
MHSCFGPRFVLGLGRGEAGAFRGMGIPTTTTRAMVESAQITRRLWAGEVVTAPDMDEVEAISISAGRLVTYLQYPYYGDVLATANNWDLETVNRLRNHEQFRDLDRAADLTFHRHEMLGPASVLPWDWITDCSAIGTTRECVTSLQRFLDAGADEVTTYGSTPRQNAALISAWRDRPQAASQASPPHRHTEGAGS